MVRRLGGRVAWRRSVSRPGLDREDLVEAAPVARLAGERRAEERDGALVGRLRPDDPGAQGQHVHVVVLDALVGGVRVVADRGADAADLVGRHAAPTPEPQMRMPRSASPSTTASPSRSAKSG